MAGQPNVFDCAIVIASESGAPLNPPYSIIEAPGDTLTLRSYFHCGGTDRVVRNAVSNALNTAVGATVTVRYFFQDLQAQAIVAPTPFEPGGPFSKLTRDQINAEFLPGGDLYGSSLDPTDDYWRSDDTAAITTAVAGKLALPLGAVNGTWRILTVIRGVNGTDRVAAFHDSLVIHVQG